MQRRSRMIMVFLVACGAAVPTIAGVAAPSALGPAGAVGTAPLASEFVTSAEADVAAGRLPETLMRDYRALWPRLTDGQIRARYATSAAREDLNEHFADRPTFGGSWFDFENNLWHLYSTSPGQGRADAEQAHASGVDAVSSVVAYSYRALEAKRLVVESALRGRAVDYQLSVSARTNRVALILPTEEAGLAAPVAADPAVQVTLAGNVPHGYPAACTDRHHCGAPLRGGISFGRFENGASRTDGCSIGFTATAADRSRWIYTAGHCILQSEVNAHTVYGHGEQPIGDARSTYQSGSVDVGRVRIGNSYWLAAGGGYMYRAPNSPVEVDAAITSASSIQMGDPVCLNARNFAPTDDNCGVITAVNVTGKPQVSGIKVCGGDSGGSVYLLASGGRRVAYGIISVSSPRTFPGDCTGNGTGQMSFSSIPLINAYMDSVTAANIRVDVR